MPSLPSPRIESSHFVRALTMPKTVSDHHITPSPSLFTNRRSSEVFPCWLTHIICVRKLPSTCSRNLLECLLSTVLSFQQRSSNLKIMRHLPVVCRMLCLPLHPGWVVLKRLPPGYLPCWPSSWFLPIGTQTYDITILELYTVETLPTVQRHPTTSPSSPNGMKYETKNVFWQALEMCFHF